MSASIRDLLASGAWNDLAAWLPRDLDQLAAESLGFQRRRAIQSPSDFVRVAMDELRGRFAQAAALDVGALRGLVEDGLAAAEDYGLYADEEIMPFLGCRVVYGARYPSTTSGVSFV